jgi:hypothetical protein
MNKSGLAGAYSLLARKKKREDIIGPEATVTVVQHQADSTHHTPKEGVLHSWNLPYRFATALLLTYFLGTRS